MSTWIRQRISDAVNEALGVLENSQLNLTDTEIAVGVAEHLLSDVKNNGEDYE